MYEDLTPEERAVGDGHAGAESTAVRPARAPDGVREPAFAGHGRLQRLSARAAEDVGVSCCSSSRCSFSSSSRLPGRRTRRCIARGRPAPAGPSRPATASSLAAVRICRRCTISSGSSRTGMPPRLRACEPADAGRSWKRVPSLPFGLRQNPPGPEQNGQKTRGAAHRRRVVPPSLPRSFDKTRGVQVRAGTVDTSCVAFRYGDRAADLVHPRAASRPCPSAPRLYLIRLSEPVRYRA